MQSRLKLGPGLGEQGQVGCTATFHDAVLHLPERRHALKVNLLCQLIKLFLCGVEIERFDMPPREKQITAMRERLRGFCRDESVTNGGKLLFKSLCGVVGRLIGLARRRGEIRRQPELEPGNLNRRGMNRWRGLLCLLGNVQQSSETGQLFATRLRLNQRDAIQSLKQMTNMPAGGRFGCCVFKHGHRRGRVWFWCGSEFVELQLGSQQNEFTALELAGGQCGFCKRDTSFGPCQRFGQLPGLDRCINPTADSR